MRSARPISRPFAGAIAGLGIGLIVFLTYTFLPRTAPPGTVAPVGPADGRLPATPEDGMLAPQLSAAEMEKIDEGQAVEIKMGGGVLRIEATKPGEQK